MSTHFSVCNQSVVPVRAQASETSEMVSQLLFGELFTVIDSTKNWVHIQNTFDNYTGWIDKKLVTELSKETYELLITAPSITLTKPFNLLLTHNKSPLWVPAGSSVPIPDAEGCFYFGNQAFYMKDDFYLNRSSEQKPETLAKQFLNAPYLWGGKTIFGMDCSGFTQLVYKLINLALPRDASQQVMHGTTVDFLEVAQSGDLAFFDNAEGTIIHVGILLNQHQIIHASGNVRIDTIDHQGIFNSETQNYSHKLRIIKRLT